MKRILSFLIIGTMLMPCGCAVVAPNNEIVNTLEGTADESAVLSAPSETETPPDSSADTTEASTEAPEPEKPEMPSVLRIACVGDSITYGVGASDRTKTSYPAVLLKKLTESRSDVRFSVLNYGRSRAYAINNSEVEYKYASAQSAAYTATAEYKNSLRSNPDIVLIMLGANDAYTASQNKDVSAKYTAALEKLIADYRALETKPVVYLMLCTDRFDTAQRRNDLKNIILPAIKDVAERLECPVIDMYSLSTEIAVELFKTPSAQRKLGASEDYSDSVHPGDKLYEIMATEAAKAIINYYK